jgi:GNAT superfamily N-acetyltransferase
VYINNQYDEKENNMTLKPRPYNGIQDFVVMTSILAVGRKTTKRPYYVHTGDLSWWMFNDDHDDAHWKDHITLWDHDGHPCGWSLIDPDWYSFDVYLLPKLRGSKEENYILDWTIRRLTDEVHQQGGSEIRTVWVSEYDSERIDQLEQRGFFKNEDFMWYLEHPLDAHIPELNLPQDFVVRPIRGETEIQSRAAAAYDAVGSTACFEDYWPRYQSFMDSLVYNPSFDLVTEAPDGQIASFCMLWPDPVNRIGLVDPVGTCSTFKHQGFGRAVITAGLRQLKTWGMNRAMISIEHNNPAALQRYQAVGFSIKHRLHTYVKQV